MSSPESPDDRRLDGSPEPSAGASTSERSIPAYLWENTRGLRGRYLGGLLFLLATNGLALSIPWLVKDAIDRIEGGSSPGTIAGFALAIAAIAAMQAVVRTASRVLVLGNSRRIAYRIRERFFRQLQRLSGTFYDTYRTGDIMSRGVNDVQLLRSFYGPGVMNALNTTVVYVAATALMLRIDVELTLWSASLAPLLLLAVNRISRRVYTRSKAVQEQLAEVSSRVQENLSGIQQVKTYAQEDREIASFRELCLEFRHRNLQLATLRGAMLAAIGVFSGLALLVVLYVGGLAVIEGRITFGDFVAFQAYLGLLTFPTIALGWIINTFQRGFGAMERIAEILDREPDVPAAIDDDETPGIVRGDLVIRGLTFEYTGVERGRPALHAIDLTVEEGSRVAIVGPVGSGKSTLVQVLARTYPIERGAVFFGGRDLVDLPVSTVRRSIACVPQEAFLFSKSIRDNVLFGEPDADEAELERALDVSQFTKDLQAFPEGLDTVVGERGFTLSGGQRQRATIARAVLSEGSLLIVDDGLSAVDADTERAILDALREQMDGHTTILITHRLTGLQEFDRIHVFDEGRLVESGTHAELAAAGGTFAHMLRKQRLETRLEARE